jgi:enoyl-CoA hydratase/carnithine racemase
MHRRNVNTDDLIGQVYGSADFREGVRSFLEHRQAKFRGC